jgi:hypothetical protein
MPAEYEPTAEQRALVESASAIGITQAEIANQLKIDEKTLRKHFRGELSSGKFKVYPRAAQRPSHAVRSPGGYFPVGENRRHSRGLGWGEPVSGRQLPVFRSVRGGFWAPVSAGDFPISVSAVRRPVLAIDALFRRSSRRQASGRDRDERKRTSRLASDKPRKPAIGNDPRSRVFHGHGHCTSFGATRAEHRPLELARRRGPAAREEVFQKCVQTHIVPPLATAMALMGL